MSVPSISALTEGTSFKACTQARTKKLMKPSFTPFFFSNRSLYWLRVCITALMSTSLKVVSMAGGFCGSLSGRARRHGGGRHRRGRGALDCRHHVAFGDASVLAGARHRGDVEAGLAREL